MTAMNPGFVTVWRAAVLALLVDLTGKVASTRGCGRGICREGDVGREAGEEVIGNFGQDGVM